MGGGGVLLIRFTSAYQGYKRNERPAWCAISEPGRVHRTHSRETEAEEKRKIGARNRKRDIDRKGGGGRSKRTAVGETALRRVFPLPLRRVHWRASA